MTRDGYVLDRCPPWCVEQEHPTDRIINIKTHQSAVVTFAPQASGGGYNTVSLNIVQAEALDDDGPTIEPPGLYLGADDAVLTSAEARQVAAMLLDQADALDQLSG